jgi:hypothetical protein
VKTEKREIISFLRKRDEGEKKKIFFEKANACSTLMPSPKSNNNTTYYASFRVNYLKN